MYSRRGFTNKHLVDGGVFHFRKLAIVSDSSDHECDAPTEVVRDLAENKMPLSHTPALPPIQLETWRLVRMPSMSTR